MLRLIITGGGSFTVRKNSNRDGILLPQTKQEERKNVHIIPFLRFRIWTRRMWAGFDDVQNLLQFIHHDQKVIHRMGKAINSHKIIKSESFVSLHASFWIYSVCSDSGPNIWALQVFHMLILIISATFLIHLWPNFVSCNAHFRVRQEFQLRWGVTCHAVFGEEPGPINCSWLADGRLDEFLTWQKVWSTAVRLSHS